MKTVQLGEVARIDRDGVDPAALTPETTYVGLEHIQKGGVIDKYSTVGQAGVKSGKFRFTAGHVLFGKLRPNLVKIARPDVSGVCSTDILPVKPSERLNRDFLVHYLRQPTMVSYASTRTTGVNLPRLSPAELFKFPMPLPPLDEQRRIAGILDQADAIRTKRRASLDLFDELQVSVFRDMFIDDFGGGHWEMQELKDTAVVQGGLQVSAKRKLNPIEVPYLRVANVYRGRMNLSEIKTMRVLENELSRTRLVENDLLFVEGHANGLEVGRAARWEGGVSNCTHQNHLIRARPNTQLLNPAFAETWFNLAEGAHHFRLAGRTTSGLHTISTRTVQTAPVPVPPIELQREFAARVEQINAQRALVEQALAKDEELFASLQSRAFKGEL